ncbi:hypothetical protein L873DRAFT_1806292 [Choiromyces venosus 120613-1]|uniref:Uncharacterized protein n=1 Tax=Choiromyces venosus 120613-1 TaxID=1336337 RepID=A0A3N4JSG8_9PEZI|nr:hypothetical protein L873DRAFT_1806292 [Choiromyces venosus 120613-1]
MTTCHTRNALHTYAILHVRMCTRQPERNEILAFLKETDYCMATKLEEKQLKQ